MSEETILTNKPIRTIIIDDDKPSIDILRQGLASHPDVQIVATSTSIADGLALVEAEAPDLLFLDIEFPETCAIDLFDESASEGPMKIVFYSSYSKYLLRALRLKVFDFLLKPFDASDLELILQRYRLSVSIPAEMKEGEDANYRRQLNLPTALSTGRKAIAITTVTNDRVIVPADSIVYFRYDGNRKIWEVVLNTLKRYLLKRHTTADNILNYGPDFVRTHKAFIVNIAYISLITPSECRLLPPLNHVTEIKISKNYRRDLLDRFYDI